MALLGVFEFDYGRAWKRYNFDTMDSLHAKGLITAPPRKQESVESTEQGLRRAKELATQYFGLPPGQR